MKILATSLFLVTLSAPVTSAQTPSPASAQGSCVVCHALAATAFARSAHAAVDMTCVSCHGGDPSITEPKKACVEHPTFLGIPAGKDITERCATCHSDLERMRPYGLKTDQLALFKGSPHGELLYEKGSPDAPTCVSCHGAHDVLLSSNADSRSYRARVPETCATCHADAEMMARHDQPSDVFAKYAGSAHGKGVVEGGQLRLPNCVDCHGSHGARPAGVKEVVHVCGHCHVATQEHFLRSPHYTASQQGKMEQCITCHGHHDIPPIGNPVDAPWDASACSECHDPSNSGDPAGGAARQMDRVLNGLRAEIGDVGELLVQARGDGIVTSEEESYLNDARHTLIMAGPVSHTASVEELVLLTQKGTGILERIRESVEIKLRRVRDRRLTICVVCGVLVVFILLLRFKLRALTASDTRAESGP